MKWNFSYIFLNNSQNWLNIKSYTVVNHTSVKPHTFKYKNKNDVNQLLGIGEENKNDVNQLLGIGEVHV